MDSRFLNKPKKGLGRGLSALISSAPVSVHAIPSQVLDSSQLAKDLVTQDEARTQETVQTVVAEATNISERIRYVPIAEVKANPTQPRTHFDDSEIVELSASIKELGVLQPVLVRPASDSGFEIVAGERRWRAAKRAGLTHLPVIIRNLTDKEGLEIAIVENVQRSNLNPLEEAKAYERLAREFNLSQREIAERVSKDRATVANIMRLTNLNTEVQKLLEEGKISLGHAKALLTVKEPAAQKNIANKVVAEGLSVRAVEEIVGRVVVLDPSQKKGATKRRSNLDASGYSETAFTEITDKLRQNLGTKVRLLHHRTGKGKIEIEYFSEAELDRLVDFLSR
jgi:ParB family chromosome partitioning protein